MPVGGLEVKALWYDNSLLSDFTFDGNMVTGYTGTSTEIVIPNCYYKNGVNCFNPSNFADESQKVYKLVLPPSTRHF